MAAGAAEADDIVSAKAVVDFEAMAAEPSNPLGAAVRRFGATIATRLASLPHLAPYNKARGFDLADRERLPAIEEFFHQVSLPSRVEVAGTAHRHVAPLLEGRGYAPAPRTAATLELDLGSRPVADNPIPCQVDAGAPLTATGYLRALVEGYGFQSVPAAQLRVLEHEHRTPGLIRYTAGHDPVAAAAALFLAGPTAYLAGAATVEEMRGQGYQSALIERRLADAGDGGCARAVATVELGSPSHRNLERFGFEVAAVRVLWTRSQEPAPPPGA